MARACRQSFRPDRKLDHGLMRADADSGRFSELELRSAIRFRFIPIADAAWEQISEGQLIAQIFKRCCDTRVRSLSGAEATLLYPFYE
jgi:hypothetical protein